jgi:hypothetical protein
MKFPWLSPENCQSYFTTGGLLQISSSWRRAPWDSRPDFFFQLNTCGHSSYVTSSLTRGWVCRLQLWLALASAFILRSESSGTHDHILLSQIRDSPNLKGQVHVFISSKNKVVQLYPRHWVPFPLHYTDLRATAEVIRTLLHTLEDQTAMPWSINLRWTEYKT